MPYFPLWVVKLDSNLSLDLFSAGILDDNDIEMIGAKPDAIKKGEDRELFKQAMVEIGLDVALSFSVHSLEEARDKLPDLGISIILRPAYTLGEPVEALPTTVRNSTRCFARAWMHPLSVRFLWKSACWGGKSTKWR